jgi:hypothetical protein
MTLPKVKVSVYMPSELIRDLDLFTSAQQLGEPVNLGPSASRRVSVLARNLLSGRYERLAPHALSHANGLFGLVIYKTTNGTSGPPDESSFRNAPAENARHAVGLLTINEIPMI